MLTLHVWLKINQSRIVFPPVKAFFSLHMPCTCLARASHVHGSECLLKGVSGGGGERRKSSCVPAAPLANRSNLVSLYFKNENAILHQFFKPFRRENSSADPPAQVFQRSPLDITWIFTYREFVDMSYHGRLFPCSVSVANNSRCVSIKHCTCSIYRFLSRFP